MPYAWSNGFRTYYEDAGAGFPIVLVHGHTFDGTMWEPQMEALSGRYRVITFDLRGHGRSEVPATGYRASVYADDMRQLLDHLEVGRCALMGLSVGGSVVIQFTLNAPQRVAALVLADSRCGRPPQTQEEARMHRRMREVTAARGYQVALEEIWLPGPLFRGARLRPEVFALARQMCQGYSGQGFRDPQPAQPDPDLASRFAEIGVPTLVIHGDLDTADVLLAADLAERTIPKAQRVVIPNAGHTANLEEPQAFNRALLAFLDGALAGL